MYAVADGIVGVINVYIEKLWEQQLVYQWYLVCSCFTIAMAHRMFIEMTWFRSISHCLLLWLGCIIYMLEFAIWSSLEENTNFKSQRIWCAVILVFACLILLGDQLAPLLYHRSLTSKLYHFLQAWVLV